MLPESNFVNKVTSYLFIKLQYHEWSLLTYLYHLNVY